MKNNLKMNDQKVKLSIVIDKNGFKEGLKLIFMWIKQEKLTFKEFCVIVDFMMDLRKGL